MGWEKWVKRIKRQKEKEKGLDRVHNKYRSWDVNLSIVFPQSLFNHYVRSNLNVRVSHRWANLWDYTNACGQD